MIHCLLIDPLEKLTIKKDSSLLLALTLQKLGHEAYVFFEEDLSLTNKGDTVLTCTQFNGNFSSKDFKLSSFELGEKKPINLGKERATIHMRLDPPFDSRYQRILWMLRYIQNNTETKVINNPTGIMAFNEKLTAFEHESSLETFLGASESAFLSFIEKMRSQGVENFILKPLDLYQGIGVEKISGSLQKDKLELLFKDRVQKFGGAVIVQPFAESVAEGEIRTFFFKGKELGTIKKIPPAGEFLANIAQGARYERADLNASQLKSCQEICRELDKWDVPWVAFDILGDAISEVNVTCPGLLNELSDAAQENLAERIIEML